MGKYELICRYAGCSSHTDERGKTTIIYKFYDDHGYQLSIPVYCDVTARVGDLVKCTLVLKRNYDFNTMKNHYYFYFEKVENLYQ